MTGQKPINDRGDRATYYANAQSWADDRQDGLRRSQKLAWVIAGVAIGIACLEALALASLAPLKRVELNTLLVDRQTGYTRMLKGDGIERIAADEALTQSLLAQYVIARESFDITTAVQDYRKVGLWSADTARSGYVAMMQANNPSSPLRRLPRTSLIVTRIKSVSLLGPGTALVRFGTERLDQGQLENSSAPWVAVLRYRFAKAPMSLDDRLLNPLGFQVTQYRRDQEAPPSGDAGLAPQPRSPSGMANTDGAAARPSPQISQP